jgi:hypothetical protein
MTKKKKYVGGEPWLTSIILVTQEAEISLKPAQANSSQDPILKILTLNRAVRVVQVIECLSSKLETLGSYLSTVKTKKKNYIFKKKQDCVYVGGSTLAKVRIPRKM